MANLKSPWGRVSWQGTQTVGVIIGLIALFLLILVLGLAWLVFLGFVLYWNITDIQHVGPNFWNIFWIVLAGLGILTALFGNRGAK